MKRIALFLPILVLASVPWLFRDQAAESAPTAGTPQFDPAASGPVTHAAEHPRQSARLALISTAAQRALEDLQALLHQPVNPMQQRALLQAYHQLASVDGRLAMQTILASTDAAQKRTLLGPVLCTWSDVAPLAALQWLDAPGQDPLRAEAYVIPARVYSNGFRALALDDVDRAARSLPAVEGAEERITAVIAMIQAAQETGRLPSLMSALAAFGDLRAAEHAAASKLVGDDTGYRYWLEQMADAPSRKIVAKLIGQASPAP